MSNKIEPDVCTVIITSFQRERYIISTVNSVLNQTYRPIELIVIDDGSTDKTFEILKDWENKIKTDKHFKTIIFKQENTGAPGARNRALNMSSGEFIQEIGSDDLIHPRKLEIQIKALRKNPDCDSAWNPMLKFEDHEMDDLIQPINDSYRNKKSTYNLFAPQFMPSAGLHRSYVFKKTGEWNPNLKRWQDFEYQTRMMKVVDMYLQFTKPFYFFRQHNNGRINDMYESNEGIENGLIALKSTELFLFEENIENNHVKKTMKNMYLSLFFTSLKSKSYDYINPIISKAIKWTSEPCSKLRLKLLKLFIYVIPISFIGKLVLKSRYGK